MKKIVFLLIALLLISSYSFAQTSGGGGGGLTLDIGIGLMYLMPTTATQFLIFNLRGGGNIALAYNLGIVEIGAEAGLYVMGVEIGTYTLLMFEIPINALVRLPLGFIDIEAYGGAWIEIATVEEASASALGFDFGARIVISGFYIGAAYVIMDPYDDFLALEVGIKIGLF